MTLERAAYILAMKILQSDLFPHCTDEERLAITTATGVPPYQTPDVVSRR